MSQKGWWQIRSLDSSNHNLEALKLPTWRYSIDVPEDGQNVVCNLSEASVSTIKLLNLVKRKLQLSQLFSCSFLPPLDY